MSGNTSNKRETAKYNKYLIPVPGTQTGETSSGLEGVPRANVVVPTQAASSAAPKTAVVAATTSHKNQLAAIRSQLHTNTPSPQGSNDGGHHDSTRERSVTPRATPNASISAPPLIGEVVVRVSNASFTDSSAAAYQKPPHLQSRPSSHHPSPFRPLPYAAGNSRPTSRTHHHHAEEEIEAILPSARGSEDSSRHASAPPRGRRYASPQSSARVKWEAVPDFSRESPARGYGASENRRSAPRYRMVLSEGAAGGVPVRHGPKTAAESRLEFAEKVASKGILQLASGHGTTFTLPSVPKTQLTAMMGGAGAVRHKGTHEFSESLPPPRLVAHQALPVAPKGAIYEVRAATPQPRSMRSTPSSPHLKAANQSFSFSSTKGNKKQAQAPAEKVAPPRESDGGAYESFGVPIPFETATGVKGTMIPVASKTKSGSMQREDQRLSVLGDGAVVREGEEEEEEDDDEYEVISYWEAAKHLTPFASYATMYLSLTMIMTVLPLGFVGNRLGEDTLAGASVGYFMLCIFAVYPTLGMMYALDTLCSHEYGRDPTSDSQGLLLQRGLITGLGFLFGVCVLFYTFVERALLALYNPRTVTHAVNYLRYAPLFLVPLASYSAFAKFNANQQLPHVPLIATAVGVGSMIILLNLFVEQGLEAVMLCSSIACWVQLLVIVVISYSNPITRKTLGAIRLREAIEFEETKAYLRIAIPAAVFVAAETAAFDLSILLATAVSEAAGSAWSALLSYELVFVCVGGGFSAAACAKVGAAIGANQPINAKTYAWTALTMSMAIAIFINAPLIFIWYEWLITTFGGNLEEAIKLHYLFPFMYIIDTIQFTFQGIFGGASMNDLGAQLLLLCLWVVGVPLALFFSMGWWNVVANWFSHSNLFYPFWSSVLSAANDGKQAVTDGNHKSFYWGWFASFSDSIRSLEGLMGVAMGILIGICILGPCMIYALTRIDWDSLALQAQIESEEGDEEEVEEAEIEEEEEGERNTEVSGTSDDVHTSATATPTLSAATSTSKR